MPVSYIEAIRQQPFLTIRSEQEAYTRLSIEQMNALADHQDRVLQVMYETCGEIEHRIKKRIGNTRSPVRFRRSDLVNVMIHGLNGFMS